MNSNNIDNNTTATYTKKDFMSNQDVKWCPGCGDYAILASLQNTLAKSNKLKENYVCVSGIGCSSRLPYYMNTYGLHTIHGRAPAVATGLKLINPELTVWVITGDGDGLSIGAGHLIHCMRRNIDVNILLFNNEIYGLTKGQNSPTSSSGTVTKAAPYGGVETPVNAGKLALGSGARFFARTLDTNPKDMSEVMLRAQDHQGTSLIEVFQNCVIFNDKVHEHFAHRSQWKNNTIIAKHGEPLLFGTPDAPKGIRLNQQQVRLEVFDITDEADKEQALVHDETNEHIAYLLIHSTHPPHFPMVLGVIYCNPSATLEEKVHKQMAEVTHQKGQQTVADLLNSGKTWEIS